MSEERKCPHCGVRVYETDDVCMSCGRSLTEVRRPAPEEEQPATPQPPPQPPPITPRQTRPPSTSQIPTTARIVRAVGGFWNIFPWAAIGFGALAGLLPQVAFELAPFLVLPYLLVTGLVGLALVVWIIIDVIHQEASVIWLLVCLFCSPIGLVLYLLLGRQ